MRSAERSRQVRPSCAIISCPHAPSLVLGKPNVLRLSKSEGHVGQQLEFLVWCNVRSRTPTQLHHDDSEWSDGSERWSTNTLRDLGARPRRAVSSMEHDRVSPTLFHLTAIFVPSTDASATATERETCSRGVAPVQCKREEDEHERFRARNVRQRVLARSERTSACGEDPSLRPGTAPFR